VTDHAEEISEALAERLASIQPRAAEDPKAQLAPFADPNVATRISNLIDQGLTEPGVREVSDEYRKSARVLNAMDVSISCRRSCFVKMQSTRWRIVNTCFHSPVS
jgi:hypothetical protein